MAMSPSPQMHFPCCKQGGWQSPPSRYFCTPWYPTDSFKLLTWVPELRAAAPYTVPAQATRPLTQGSLQFYVLQPQEAVVVPAALSPSSRKS